MSDNGATNVVDLDRIYGILGSRTKRMIIEYLATHGRSSVSEIRKNLGISVGNLYYNLDGLSGFVEKDEEKKYYLTEHGWKIYNLIQEDTDRFNSIFSLEGTRIGFFFTNVVLPILVPVLFFKNKANERIVAVLSAAVAAAGALGLSMARLPMILLEIDPLNEVSSEVSALLYLVLSILGVVLLVHLPLFATYRKKPSPTALLATIVSLAPLSVYPYFHIALKEVVSSDLALIASILLRVLQLISLGLLTAVIASYYRVSRERAFVVAFLVFYISFMLNLFL